MPKKKKTKQEDLPKHTFIIGHILNNAELTRKVRAKEAQGYVVVNQNFLLENVRKGTVALGLELRPANAHHGDWLARYVQSQSKA